MDINLKELNACISDNPTENGELDYLVAIRDGKGVVITYRGTLSDKENISLQKACIELQAPEVMV